MKNVFLKIYEILAIIVGSIILAPVLLYLAVHFTWLFIIIIIFGWPVLYISKTVKIRKLEKEIKALKKEA